eukprot:gene14591-biopygen23631
MQSKVSYSSHYRAPAAARFSALRSPIPSRPILRPYTERWTGLPRAFQNSLDSRVNFVRGKARSSKVTEWIEKSEEELVYGVRSGVVKSITPFGVFVDIGAGVDALLHVSRISSGRVKEEDIENLFSVGADIKVMVLEMDDDRQRISLSTKDLEVNPGDMVKNPQVVYATAEEVAAAYRAKVEASKQQKEKASEVVANLKVNELRSGVVQSVAKYGVFVDIGAGSVGLLHASQISSESVSEVDMKKMFSVGDEIKVVVCKIDDILQRFNLSTKLLEVNPGDMIKNPQLVYKTAEETAAALRAKFEVDPNLKVHELRSGVVQRYTKQGVFVDIGAGTIGWLHKDQISHERVNRNDVEKMFSVGDEIKVMVRKIDSDGVSLSTKNLEVNPGDMVKDPKLVYSKAEETAAAFQAKIASEAAAAALVKVATEAAAAAFRAKVATSEQEMGV